MYEPHTDKSTTCTVCTRYTSLVSNAARVRRDGNAPGCALTLAEFATWFVQTPLRCTYCGIPEFLIQYLGLRTQVDQPLARLGIDRVDTSRPYQPDNMVLCCFACNKAKSNTFTPDEMSVIGQGVARAWMIRLAAADVEWIAAD